MSKEKGTKNHSKEFREFVAKQVIQDGRKITEMAQTLNIPYGTIKNWVQGMRKEYRKAENDRQEQLLTASEYKQLYEKERQEKLELQEENDIIKKAMHIFTQDQK
ncbi:transposase [Alteribacillus sp. JSM 102045]|uniref:transposase n=1 Tax=Alteribacillus sp. JSM 102045 TaxID=1562101 RepID=UPI0035C208DC